MARWIPIPLAVLATCALVIEVARYAVERGRHQQERCDSVCLGTGYAGGAASDTGCECTGEVEVLCDESARESRAQGRSVH